MKSIASKLAQPAGLGLLAALILLSAGLVRAQPVWPFTPPTSPMAQRNSVNVVINQVKWLQNATRTSASFAGGGYGLLMQQFQAVRDQYAGFKSTLTPQQLTVGADQIAELDAGLDIIQEAFADFQTAMANGQSSVTAFANLRRGLNQAIGVWAQEFKRTCNQLRVGW